MAVFYDENTRTFKLDAGKASYAFTITPQGDIFHLYYGAHVSDGDLSHLQGRGGGASFCASPADAPEYNLDTSLQEYPGNGLGDFRVAAIAAEEANGASGVRLKYVSHKILQGKPPIPSLPSTYCNHADEAQTLAVATQDAHLGLRVTLYYCAFAQYSVITRWAIAENIGARPIKLQSVQSACVDFDESDYDMISLHGAWIRERAVERHALFHGTQSVGSKRGSSGHQLNPFAVICRKDATEQHGEAYGFQLVYSGNFCIEAEVSQMHTTRVTLGINPTDFAWMLMPGESFASPEAVLGYSDEGIGGLSRTLHRLYRNNLIRGTWKHKTRPVLINNWEATYFDFDADKLVAIAHEAAKTGIDLLVMDDGWFGVRNSDNCSLGDWTVNEDKLGCSLATLAERIKAEGLAFGIWFEPEMISPDSDLYRAHPDWALHIPGRESSLGRNQYVINMCLPEVRDNLFAQISAVLSSADISYLKWDFNRNLTEVFSAGLPPERGREVWHRYILGLYELLERLTEAFPDVLFESCSGGGGRFDLGMLYYMPQTWCSDNTDAVDRLKIQYGTSMAYPIASMGAHVQMNTIHSSRRTSLQFRASVAMAGTFGYELDLTKLSQDDIAEMKAFNEEFRKWQPLIATGDFYRLESPFEGAHTAWMFVAADKSKALLSYFCTFETKNDWRHLLRLQGLNPTARYHVSGYDFILSGDTLMRGGLRMPKQQGDAACVNVMLEACAKLEKTR
ncbi:MAG: alpha-galactosidase [Oscillospiraceae bacterium]|jgi:alpha-galactosidase|nr:alpha-galactosidase [Oscillospiraceae bacterium]